MNQLSSPGTRHWRRSATVMGRLLPAVTIAVAVAGTAAASGAAHARNSTPGSAAAAAAPGSARSLAAARTASSTCIAGSGLQPPNPGSSASLKGVAVVSSSRAFAVGSYISGGEKTLAEHWNGSSWTVVPSPSPGIVFNDPHSVLNGVAATSSHNAWAAGSYTDQTGQFQALILHWNGTTWKQQASAPIPFAESTQLFGVTVASTSNAWAVGSTIHNRIGVRAVIEHWNGTTWKLMRTPKLAGAGAELLGVTAVSSRNVWAVGHYWHSGGISHTLIEHWNGTAWRHVTSPNPGGPAHDNLLRGVTALSGRNAWAVGDYDAGEKAGATVSKTIILRWNGIAWKRITSPNPGWGSVTIPADILTGATAISPSNVWAVGSRNDKNALEQTLVEHWNGSAWKSVRSPSPQRSSFLFGVDSTTASNIWAVGNTSAIDGPSLPLAVHCG